ncbi:FMN-dependent NADH-azoreductase [Bacillus sp. FJAT-27264]|uniref:FMN-dependent NADH-azoreductase n=1 Tax=Paenibacillus sp. (strain DSM 101736 / FJAT-27264) TaxID=1850362 RepID=UPI000807F1DC|nr:FMN-dependent NADH-azoreductase [Bacillus sp. FJAT-27264]OBZ15017.1 FMN-dependent NADH-azoreductase [Bacillus sp. FJAT-27264]
MKQILIIEVSPREAESASRAVTDKLSMRLKEEFPEAKFVYRDLAKDPIPHLDDSTLKAISSKIPEEVAANKESAHLSDQLTKELLESDVLVIATPMWNFGIPSVLKAWLDLVVRPGKTFTYTETGVLGLAKDKKAIIVVASGGVFTEGAWKAWDFVEPYLRQILSFIGIENVQVVRAQGTNIPQLAESAIPNAEQSIAKLEL